MDDHTSRDHALRLLVWYRDMGADAALGDEPVDWLARGEVKPGVAFSIPPLAVTAPQPQPIRKVASAAANAAALDLPPAARSSASAAAAATPTKPLPAKMAAAPAPPGLPRAFAAPAPDAAVAAARNAARDAANLDDLGRVIATFDGCILKATAKNLCFYRGALQAPLMIIGEPPGRDDDLSGLPASGPAGTLLEKMLAAIGLDSASCHITNAVYWRPPGNRAPTSHELEVCRPFLERQIALVAPRVLILFGEAAAKQVMTLEGSFMRARGKWRELALGGHSVRAMATLPPNYLFKMPAHKKHVWRDLLAVKSALSA